MKIVIAYTSLGSLQPQEIALANERHHLRVNGSRDKPALIEFEVGYREMKTRHDYGDMLAELWEKGEPFINLEQDVLPWPGALTELWKCSEPWCALPIIVNRLVNHTNLGCVKFSAGFIKSYPDVWESYPRNDVFDWGSLDSWLYKQMKPVTHHRHGPPAIHLNSNHVL